MKAILFDVDGVLAVPEELFGNYYARKHNLDLSRFFEIVFKPCLLGQADLKEVIEKNRDDWSYSGDLDDLLSEWFEHENLQNEVLLEKIASLRDDGINCYMTTNQEKYRTEYINNVMFPGKFDGMFSSCLLGVRKPDKEYYEKVIDKLSREGISKEEILFIDDRLANTTAAEEFGIKSHTYTNIGSTTEFIEANL